MSGIYKAQEGQTFASVARAALGDDTLAAKVKVANPGLKEPFSGPTVVTLPKAVKESGLSGAELEVKVGGFTIGQLNDFSLSLSIDAMAKGCFTVPNVPETRAIFAPLSHPEIVVGFSGELVHTGYCLSPDPGGESLGISFNSMCSLIEGANAPISAYPLEFIDLNFQQITETLCNPFGLVTVFPDPPGARFSRVDIEEEVGLLDFLSQLAKQRNFVSTSNAKGELVMWREAAVGNKKAVAKLDGSKLPVFGRSQASIKEDDYYSSVTGIIEADPRKGKKARSFTVVNPHASGLNRPYTFIAKEADDGELETCVNTVAGRMFSGVFSVTVNVATWRDDAGDLWKPNTIIKYRDPENFVISDYEFLIADVTFNKTSESKTAELRLTMPGCYGGRVPEFLPWQR